MLQIMCCIFNWIAFSLPAADNMLVWKNLIGSFLESVNSVFAIQ